MKEIRKLKTSHRVNSLIESPIRKFLPLVREAEEKGVEFFKLNVGDPDIAIPSEILRAIKNFKDKNIGYAPSSGIAEHVEAWQKYYARFGIKLDKENIIPTVGASEGLLMSLLALTDVGDEVIVFEPLYANFKGMMAMASVKFAPVTLKIEENFKLPPVKEIIKKISKKTKAILVINPDNPTGKVWTDKELKQIIKIAHKYNLFLIGDETYREIVFKGKPKSLLNYNIKQRLIVIDSLSKRFSVPGIRIGALVSYNQDIMNSFLKMAMMRLSAPTIGQLATTDLLKNSKKYIKKIVAEYKRRRDTVRAVLASVPGISFGSPDGAFYQTVKLPVKDSEDFIRFLINDFRYHNKTLLVSPMEDFYITPGMGRNEIRIACVLESRKLKSAMEIFKMALDKFVKL